MMTVYLSQIFRSPLLRSSLRLIVNLRSNQSSSCLVRGNLAKCYNEWVKIDVIRDGHKIPFTDLLPPKVTPNNSSALKEREFVSEAIFDLLKNKCVEVLDRPPEIVNPFFCLRAILWQEEKNPRFEAC